MSELNMSTFIQVMQKGFMEHNKQESAGVFLLNAINNQEHVQEKGYCTANLDSKKISRIVSRDAHVPDGIKQASMLPMVIKGTIKYFREKVMNDLNPHLREDTIEDVLRLISIDPVISNDKKQSLIAYHNSGDDARFLAEVFLYVVNRNNMKEGKTVECEDIPLIAEANYECPLCHKKLVDTIKGRVIKCYRITQIFPENLDDKVADEFEKISAAPDSFDSLENLIALDEDCSTRYLISPTIDEYQKLRAIKEEISRNFKAKAEVNEVQLEEDVRVALDALIQMEDTLELVPLEYDALHVEEKIKPENFILKNEIQQQVVMYYRYIERAFSESEADFHRIASDIKKSANILENAGGSQVEVVEQLSEWIRNKSGLSTDAKLACDIIVSFFIQNCEVFYK